jgi:small subunit ribosomal protein S8
MSQDIIADAMNMIKNAQKAKKKIIIVNRISNLLIEVLKIMKYKGAIKGYKINSKERNMEITLGNITDCKAIKPRYSVKKTQIEKYMRRYLPARGIGTMIVSTNKGLITHEEAIEKDIGGCLVAYFY